MRVVSTCLVVSFSMVTCWDSVPLSFPPVRSRSSLTRQRGLGTAAWQLLKAARVRLVTVVDLAAAAVDSLLRQRCRFRLRVPLPASTVTGR